MLKWPRGRYNGMRIVGARLLVRVDVTRWEWFPRIIRYANAIAWMCVIVNFEAEYRHD